MKGAMTAAGTFVRRGPDGNVLEVRDAMERPLLRRPYPFICTVAGLAYGWLPMLVHGPIAAKLTVVRLNGPVAVWTYYASRLLIGFMVGCGVWPATWWLRGPLYGVLLMLPPGMLALATPGCGFT